jgi:hypothetical protein
MPKRTRKPLVKAEIRRDWIKRNEENGESPPQIAERDGFDVRTVRKQLELARQEREMREARMVVLRSALEKHYEDLRSYAENLNAQIFGTGSATPLKDEDLIEGALRQHLPRSPIWHLRGRLDILSARADEQQPKVGAFVDTAVRAEERISALTKAGLKEVESNITQILLFQARRWSQGNSELTLKKNLIVEPAEEGFINIRYGVFPIGKVEKEQTDTIAKAVREILEDLEYQLKNSEAFGSLEKTLSEIVRARRNLREELAVIRLRRIVPGHCKYCPL